MSLASSQPACVSVNECFKAKGHSHMGPMVAGVISAVPMIIGHKTLVGLPASQSCSVEAVPPKVAANICHQPLSTIFLHALPLEHSMRLAHTMPPALSHVQLLNALTSISKAGHAHLCKAMLRTMHSGL